MNFAYEITIKWVVLSILTTLQSFAGFPEIDDLLWRTMRETVSEAMYGTPDMADELHINRLLMLQPFNWVSGTDGDMPLSDMIKIMTLDEQPGNSKQFFSNYNFVMNYGLSAESEFEYRESLYDLLGDYQSDLFADIHQCDVLSDSMGGQADYLATCGEGSPMAADISRLQADIDYILTQVEESQRDSVVNLTEPLSETSDGHYSTRLRDGGGFLPDWSTEPTPEALRPIFDAIANNSLVITKSLRVEDIVTFESENAADVVGQFFAAYVDDVYTVVEWEIDAVIEISIQLNKWYPVHVQPAPWYTPTWKHRVEFDDVLAEGFSRCPESGKTNIFGENGLLYSRVQNLVVTTDVRLELSFDVNSFEKIIEIVHGADDVRIGPLCTGRACATRGNVIIGFDDSPSIGYFSSDVFLGWSYIKHAIYDLLQGTFHTDFAANTIAALGCPEPFGNRIYGASGAISSVAKIFNLTVNYYEGSLAIQRFFEEYQTNVVPAPHIIWIPGDTAEGLDRQEMQILRDNAALLDQFAEIGGGILSHGSAVGYGWMFDLLPSTEAEMLCDELPAFSTPLSRDWYPSISEQDIEEAVFSSYFSDGCFGSMQPMITDSLGNPLVMTTYGKITRDSDRNCDEAEIQSYERLDCPSPSVSVEFDCTRPDISHSNAYYSCPVLYPGEVCTFDCDEGYHLIGAFPVCLDDGTLTTPPTCEPDWSGCLENTFCWNSQSGRTFTNVEDCKLECEETGCSAIAWNPGGGSDGVMCYIRHGNCDVGSAFDARFGDDTAWMWVGGLTLYCSPGGGMEHLCSQNQCDSTVYYYPGQVIPSGTDDPYPCTENSFCYDSMSGLSSSYENVEACMAECAAIGCSVISWHPTGGGDGVQCYLRLGTCTVAYALDARFGQDASWIWKGGITLYCRPGGGQEHLCLQNQCNSVVDWNGDSQIDGGSDYCVIEVSGDFGDTEDINGLYTYQGVFEGRPYYFDKSEWPSGAYLYYLTNFGGWFLADVLGTTSVYAYVLEDVETPDLITSTWTSAPYGAFIPNPAVKASCQAETCCEGEGTHVYDCFSHTNDRCCCGGCNVIIDGNEYSLTCGDCECPPGMINVNGKNSMTCSDGDDLESSSILCENAGCHIELSGRVGHLENLNGVYFYKGLFNDHPYYKHKYSILYIYFIPEIESWILSEVLGSAEIFAYVGQNVFSADLITNSWNLGNDETMAFEIDTAVQTECFDITDVDDFSDDTSFSASDCTYISITGRMGVYFNMNGFYEEHALPDTGEIVYVNTNEAYFIHWDSSAAVWVLFDFESELLGFSGASSSQFQFPDGMEFIFFIGDIQEADTHLVMQCSDFCDVELSGIVSFNTILNGIYEPRSNFYNGRPYYIEPSTGVVLWSVPAEPIWIFSDYLGDLETVYGYVYDTAIQADHINQVWYIYDNVIFSPQYPVVMICEHSVLGLQLLSESDSVDLLSKGNKRAAKTWTKLLQSDYESVSLTFFSEHFKLVASYQSDIPTIFYKRAEIFGSCDERDEQTTDTDSFSRGGRT